MLRLCLVFLLATHNMLLAIHNMLLAIHNMFLATHNMLLATHNMSLATHNKPTNIYVLYYELMWYCNHIILLVIICQMIIE